MEKEHIAAFIDRDGVITALNSYETGEKSNYLTKKERFSKPPFGYYKLILYFCQG